MSRIISVCLCAVVAFVALLGAPFVPPTPVLAASGTLGMETPLHESPEHGAPMIALLAEGTVVSIDGPPVDGFYPVSTGNVSGWMRGETLLLEKDPAEDAETEPPVDDPDTLVPVEQTANDNPAPVDTTADPAYDPALSAEPPVTEPVAEPEWSEPAGETAYDDPNAVPFDPAAAELSPQDGSAAVDGTAPPLEPVPVNESAPVEQLPPVEEPAPVTEPTPVDAAAPAPELTDGAAPVAAEPAPAPNVTPVPVPESSPVGPASVTVDAPIRTGPGSWFDLIFTVPMGSTLNQTGHVVDGYVTVQYKEVTGWAALDHLGTPSAFVEETPPGAVAAPIATVPVEAAPIEAAPVATEPPVAEPVAAEPVAVKTPRAGSGVAFTTVDMSLRTGPSATEAPITVVPAGSRVVLTGVMEGGFQRVTYKEEIGWIADEYLQSPADPEPEIRKSGNQQQYSRKQIVRIINDAADSYGQSRSDMLRVAECESNLDPYAVNPSGSYGLFQFIRSTWKSTPFGTKDIFDPEANANAAAWMWSEGRKSEWVCQ